jgi:hypothetical protein
MAVNINDDFMSLEINGTVLATARFTQLAAADGHAAWIVSGRADRLFACACRTLPFTAVMTRA